MKTKFYTITILIAISTISLFSQSVDLSSLPKLLGATNLGKEFWFTVPPCMYAADSNNNNKISIYVSSGVETMVNLEVSGKGVSMSKKTIPNDIIEFDLTPVQGQPYIKKEADPNVAEQVFPGTGIHLYSEQPVIVYCIVKYGAAGTINNDYSEGWLCIPTSSAGKEYIVSGYNVDAMFSSVWKYKLPGTCGVVAPFNDTKVVFTMGGNSFSITAGGMKPGNSKSFTLQKGDVWMVSTNSDNADLSGSKIVSSKPVQIVTGNTCANIPTGNQTCNYTAEMDLPTFTWDSVLYVPQVTKRKYPSMIRIFAKEQNTNIYRDSKQIGNLALGGGTEGNAYLDMRIVGMDVKPRSAVFSGNKPIAITLMNTGTQEDNSSSLQSPPFFMAITPYNQYLTEMTFIAPGLHGLNNFPENYIAFISQTDSLLMMPKDVEFGQISGGNWDWKQLKSKFVGVDELSQSVNGKVMMHKVITLPGDGLYGIRAKQPFAAYLYGFNTSGSYAFPAALGLKDREHINDIMPPVPVYQYCCCSVKNGIVKDYPDDNAVRSNLSMINMDKTLSFNSKFTYADFIPGDTRTTTWKLDFIDQTKEARAVITFCDRCGNDTTIVINYKPPTFCEISKDTLDFGIIKQGDNVYIDVEIYNPSDSTDSNINLPKKLKDSVFTLDSNNLYIVLHPKERKTIRIYFTGLTEGYFSDSLIFSFDSCGIYKYMALVQGIVGKSGFFATDIDFNNTSIDLQQKDSKRLILTNLGTLDCTVLGYTISNDSAFTTNLPGIDANYKFYTPLTMKPGDTLIYLVTFIPKQSRYFLDSIVFTVNPTSTNNDNVSILRGIGFTPVDENATATDINQYLEISPNIINSTLNFKFKLKEQGNINIQIIDLKGSSIQISEHVYYSGGEQNGIIKTENLSSGIFILKLEFKDIILLKKFTITK